MMIAYSTLLTRLRRKNRRFYISLDSLRHHHFLLLASSTLIRIDTQSGPLPADLSTIFLLLNRRGVITPDRPSSFIHQQVFKFFSFLFVLIIFSKMRDRGTEFLVCMFKAVSDYAPCPPSVTASSSSSIIMRPSFNLHWITRNRASGDRRP